MANPDNVGQYLLSARTLAEYTAMFSLAPRDLRGNVLDCPGGASSFTAEATGRGARVTAVDPIYALPRPLLRRHAIAEQARGSAHTQAGHGRYLWDFYGDSQGHQEMRRQGAVWFAADLDRHPERYVAAALPCLPVADGQFDLVLSSHFLFTYADRLDLEFHLASLIELRRVSAGDARVFPILDQSGRRLEKLVGEVVTSLIRAGIAAEFREVRYEFQRGGNQMLVLPAP